MDYICSANIMVDTVFLQGGGTRTSMGGPALFALTGAALFSESTLMVSRVGADFKEYFGEYFEKNGFPLSGTKTVADFCNHYEIIYHEDGSYTEQSKFGVVEGNRAFGMLSVVAEDIAPYIGGAKGLYFGRGVTNMVVWDGVRDLRAQSGVKIMWEIPTTQAVPENKDRINKVLSFVDFFSINHHEAKVLYGTPDDGECIRHLLDTGVPTYYRVGKKGAYIVKDGVAVFCPSYFSEYEPDPTGCGNCSTGAVMVGLCEGRSAAECAAMGSAAASFNARQFGPYPLIDGAAKAEATLIVKTLQKECTK